MSNNFYQAFNSISDSMTKTVPKEIKMTNEVDIKYNQLHSFPKIFIAPTDIAAILK